MNRMSHYRVDNPQSHLVPTFEEEPPRNQNVGAPYVLCTFVVGVVLMGVGTFITAHAQEQTSENFVLFVVGLSVLSVGGIFLLGAVIVCAIACCKNRSLQRTYSGDILYCGESTFYGNKSFLHMPEEDEENENKEGQVDILARKVSHSRRAGRGNQAFRSNRPESGVEVLAKTMAEERHRVRGSPPVCHRSSGNYELDMLSLERLGLDHLGLERLHRARAQEALAMGYDVYHPKAALENDKQQRGRSYSMTTRGNAGDLPVKLIRNTSYNTTMRSNRKHRQEEHLHFQEQYHKHMLQRQQKKQLYQEHFETHENPRYHANPETQERRAEGDWELEDDEVDGVRGFARRFQRKRSKNKRSANEGNHTPEIIYPLPSCSPELLEAAGIMTHTSSLDRTTHRRPDAEEANTGDIDGLPQHPHPRFRPGRGSEKQRRPTMGVSSLKKSCSTTSAQQYLHKSVSLSPASSLPRRSFHSSDVDLNRGIDSSGSLPRSQDSCRSTDKETATYFGSPAASNNSSMEPAVRFAPSLQQQNTTNGSRDSPLVCEFVPPPPPESPPPSESPYPTAYHKTKPMMIYSTPSSSCSSVSSASPPETHLCRGRVLSDIASSCCSASDEDEKDCTNNESKKETKEV